MAVHHDGYLLWDSATTKYNVKNMAGFDMTGELEKVLRKRDMKFGMTFHHAFRWWFYYPSLRTPKASMHGVTGSHSSTKRWVISLPARMTRNLHSTDVAAH